MGKGHAFSTPSGVAGVLDLLWRPWHNILSDDSRTKTTLLPKERYRPTTEALSIEPIRNSVMT